MTTSNYKLDTRYALVDTDIIHNKRNISYTKAITFFNSISDINHITQNTDITSQLSTYTIKPIIHNHVVFIDTTSELRTLNSDNPLFNPYITNDFKSRYISQS